jgi:hypothetical protein
MLSGIAVRSHALNADLTRGMQIGLGLLVLLVAIIGYRTLLRRHPPSPMRPQRWPVTTPNHGIRR